MRTKNETYEYLLRHRLFTGSGYGWKDVVRLYREARTVSSQEERRIEWLVGTGVVVRSTSPERLGTSTIVRG